jgi:ribA/ribD-fused uncharacterized protein
MSAHPSSKSALITLLAAGTPVDYLLFWGHRAANPGVADKSCLSQWWPAAYRVGDETFPTAEHGMMAGKVRLYGDEAARAAILAAPTPGKAKALGRGVKGFDETRWAEARYDLVVAVNEEKFRQNPDLAAFLISTGDRILVEASPVDPVWGIGLAADHADARRPGAWPGLNLLGFALIEVRARLQRSGA